MWDATTQAVGNAWDWLSENWKTVVDWAAAIIGGAAAILGVVALFVTLPAWMPVALAVAGVGTAAWTIYRLFDQSPGSSANNLDNSEYCLA